MSIKDKKVLIIEDMPDQAMLAKKQLENVGMMVTTASSVDAAIETLKDKSPHLILLDLEMPGKSGIAFLEYRRTQASLKEVPVVVTSALQDQGSVYRAIAVGASDYLIKPYATAKLLQKVRKHLKDTVFKSYEFPKDAPHFLRLTVPAEITKVGETGFTFESQVKIGPKAKVEIASEQLDFLEEKTGFFISEEKASTKAFSGNYLTKLRIVGITKPIQKTKAKKP